MHISRHLLYLSVLTGQALLASSTALIHVPSLRRHDMNQRMQRSSKYYEGALENRSPQNPSTEDNLSLSAPDVEKNASTTAACLQGMQTMSSVSNQEGFAACYNILDWHENMGGMFQADLRLYQFSTPVGEFTGLSMSDVTIHLDYPNSTQFSVLTNTKRSVKTLQKKQNQIIEVQQYSLVGNFIMQLDFKKLNSTQLMSLLIPKITLNANINGTKTESPLASSDTVYFVTGNFKDDATPELAGKAASPDMALAAIEASLGFVLPGTTFGIFPTGLIVTGAWCFFFIIAFGLGTMGRIRHRNIYRKRVLATSGMRPGARK